MQECVHNSRDDGLLLMHLYWVSYVKLAALSSSSLDRIGYSRLYSKRPLLYIYCLPAT